jgi:hypothetical protein
MITRDELRVLSQAYTTGRDQTFDPRVQAMIRAETARIERSFDQLTRKIGVHFTDRDPYPNFEALQHDVLTNRRMFVWKGASDTPLWTPLTNWKARALHDYDHIVTSSDFSMGGEAQAYRTAAARMPGLAPLYLSEIVLQAAVQQHTENFAPQKLIVAGPQVARVANALRGAGMRARQAPAAMVWYAAGMLKTMSPADLMVHLGAAGYEWNAAIVIADAARMLQQRRL